MLSGSDSSKLARRPDAKATGDLDTPGVRAWLHGQPLLPNSGIPLDLNWVREVRVNTSAVERRIQSQVARRTVKKEWQAAWLLRAISCMDLTTLSGDDTEERVRRLCAKAQQPIQQSTEFQRLPVTGSIKAYLAKPGRSIGHFAWIPSRYAPFVGGGGGIMWYRFRQAGDFIDFATFKVFPDTFNSDGWAPTLNGFVGTDVSLNPRFAVTIEGRYEWAHKDLSPDFARFQPIDLSGFALTAGFVIRY